MHQSHACSHVGKGKSYGGEWGVDSAGDDGSSDPSRLLLLVLFGVSAGTLEIDAKPCYSTAIAEFFDTLLDLLLLRHSLGWLHEIQREP